MSHRWRHFEGNGRNQIFIVQDPGGNNLGSAEGVPLRLLQGTFRRQWPRSCQETQGRSGRRGAAEWQDYWRQGA